MAGAICLVGGDWRMSPTPSSVDSVELTMGGSDGALERPPSRIFQAPTQAPNATKCQTVLSRNTT